MTAILLDISRTMSRVMVPIPTGIDRVERAYISEFLNENRLAWFLTQVPGGYAIFDQRTMRQIFDMILQQRDWGSVDLIGRWFGRKKPLILQQAQSTVRRMAQGLSGKKGLSAMLQRKIPDGFTYVNVGHSNRKRPLWQAIEAGGAGRKIAMVHDIIPLKFPEYSRPDTVERFAQELKFTAAHCDYLIYNSVDTQTQSIRWLRNADIKCDYVTALLGVEPLPERAATSDSPHPYFVILGTIEPRKNHMLLLEIWQQMAKNQPENTPHLHIVGRRGWLNADVFSWLDTSPLMGQLVFEHSDMGDQALGALLDGARALLFPSFAEGFGYPLVEALQKKIPAICSNLPSFQEIAGDLPLYLDPTHLEGWQKAILRYSDDKFEQPNQIDLDFPTWNKHFLIIDTIIYNKSI